MTLVQQLAALCLIGISAANFATAGDIRPQGIGTRDMTRIETRATDNIPVRRVDNQLAMQELSVNRSGDNVPRIFCPDGAENCTNQVVGNFYVMALLVRLGQGDGRSLDEFSSQCTAVRLERNWAASALHCFEDIGLDDPNAFALLLADDIGTVVFPVVSVAQVGEMDVALLEFGSQGDPWFDAVGDDVRQATPTDLGQFDPPYATAFGFGATKFIGGIPLPDALQLSKTRITVTTVDQEIWRFAPDSLDGQPRFGGGDSGGPLFAFEKNMPIGIGSQSGDRTCEQGSLPRAEFVNFGRICDEIAELTEGVVPCTRG